MHQHLQFSIIAAMIGSAGAFTGLILFQEPGFAIIAGLGALFSGIVCAPIFQRAARTSAGWSVVAAIGATVLGAGVAGLALMGLSGMVMAVSTVFLGLITNPIAGITWCLLMAGIHLAATRMSGETGN